MKENEGKIDLRRYLDAIRRGWIWYALASVVFIGTAIFYWFYRIPQYTTYSAMLIEEPEESGGGGALSALASSGVASMMRSFSIGGIGASNVDNELVVARSYDQYKETVSRLGLNRQYSERIGIKREILYKNSPVVIEAPKELFDTLSKGFKVVFDLHDGKVDAKATRGFLGYKTLADLKNQTLPFELKTPYGNFQVLKTTDYNPREQRTIKATVAGDALVTDDLIKLLTVDYADKKGDAIAFEIEDGNTERAEDIVDMMMALYNERRLDRKNETTKEQIAFVDERIASLVGELKEAEDRVEKFKNDNNLTDIQTEASVLLEQGSTNRSGIVTCQSQLLVLNMMNDFLKQPGNKYKMLPMSEGLGDQSAALVLNQYNELIVKRMSLERSARGDNAALQEITAQIDAMRSVAQTNVERMIANTKAQLSTVTGEENRFKNRLGQLPKFEREYFELMRDKELKNSLYMFLLERRESNMLKLTSNVAPGFIVEAPHSDIKPSKTKPIIVTVIAILLSLLVPTIWVLFLLARKNAVRELFDLPEAVEGNSCKIAGNAEGWGEVRNKILGLGNIVCVGAADNAEFGVASKLAEAYQAIGLSAKVVADITDAGVLLTDKYRTDLEAQAATCDTTIVVMPNRNEPATCKDYVNLVMARAGRTKRSVLKAELSGLDMDKVVCAIVE